MISLHTHKEVKLLVLELDFGTHREPFAKVDYSENTILFEPTFEADFNGVWQEYQEIGVGYDEETCLEHLEERAREQGAKLVRKHETIYRAK